LSRSHYCFCCWRAAALCHQPQDPERVITNEPGFVTHTTASGPGRVLKVVSLKENNVRRILLTMAISLFSVAAPLVPTAAGANTIKRSHHSIRHSTPLQLALEKLQDQRQMLDLEAHKALTAVATHFHMTMHQLVDKWQRVAVCEVNGNWSMKGPLYSGIGFSNATWDQFGGTRFAPIAGDATPLQQVLIGMKITKTWIPDQYGCSPAGW
jgi:hypothetical protein